MEASHVKSRSDYPPVKRPASHHGSKRRFVIDDLVILCSKTIFSPAFALLIPATTAIYLNRASATNALKQYLQGRYTLSWNSLEAIRHLTLDSRVFKWTVWYAGAVCLTSLLSKLSYAYDQGVGLFSRPKPLVWEQQVVVVTGGSGGVGKSIADKAAERRAKVVILDITKPEEELEGNIWCYICDVSDRKAVNNVALKIIKEVGVPTILVNNAGVMNGKLILDLREQDVSRTFGVNIISHFWILQAFLPGLIAAGKGHIVSVASLLGVTGTAQLTDYCASKAAVIAMHDSLTYELRNHYHTPDIRTTLVLPSHIRTNMFSQIHFPKWGGLFPFLAPTLEPLDVAEAIIGRLDSRENGTLRMPLYSHFGRVLGLAAEVIPGWARDFARWAAQSDVSMRWYGDKAE